MKATLASMFTASGLAAAALLLGADRIAPSMHHWQEAPLAGCRDCHDETGRPPTNVHQPVAFAHDSAAPPATSVRDGVPDVVVIAQLAEHYSPVMFDHRIHADMSQLSGGCTNCHHNSVAGAQVAACRECHSPLRDGGTLTQPSLKGAYHRQCLGCHRDWSHENGCGYCHREQSPRTDVAHVIDPSDIIMTPHPRVQPSGSYIYQTNSPSGSLVSFSHDGHAQAYGLKCVDCHQGGSCSGCHDGSAPVRHAAGGMPSCQACHATNNCNFCHADHARPAFEHSASTGWSLEPQHARVACVSCHGRVEAFLTPSTSCRACHGDLSPANFDHRITGVPLLGSHALLECSRCHTGSRADSPATCNGCHADKHYPQNAPGAR